MSKRAIAVALALAVVALARGARPASAGGGKDVASAGSNTLAETIEQVKKLVHVEPAGVAPDKIQLSYHLKDEPQQLDFEHMGVPEVDVTNVRGSGFAGKFAELPFGDSSGLLLHKIPLKGDVEIDWEIYARCLEERSNIFFVIGYDLKARSWVGARLGQSLVVSDGHKVTPSERVDIAPFETIRKVVVKIVRKGKSVSVFLNGARHATLTTPTGDGRWGIIATDVRVGIIKVTAIGAPDLDPAKLDNARSDRARR